jgi:hypothetical protein
MAMNTANRRYLVRLGLSMMAYMAFLYAAIHFVRDRGLTGPLAYALGALPGLAVVGVFWAIGRLLVEETDEYRRMLLVRQTLFASGFALSLATVWGFLENLSLVEHIDAFYIAITFFIGLGLGNLVNWLTLGDSGGCK